VFLVLSDPLPEDTTLFREVDVIVNEIRRCYVELDKFWVDEVQRVTKALRNRHLDTEDIDRWRNFQESLEHTIAHWEVRISSCQRFSSPESYILA
jgi:hypothetical protein